MKATAPILHQRMGGTYEEGGGPTKPDDPPLVGIYQRVEWATEGTKIGFSVKRTAGLRNVEVAFTYTFASEAGNSDFAESVTGGDVLLAGELEVVVEILTVQREGVQNNRVVSCTITNISQNAFLDPLHNPATMELRDYTQGPVGKWWITDGAWRSGRRWRGGASYWNQPATYAKYEAQVAYLDGFGAGNFKLHATDDYTVMNWDRCVGGPPGNPDVIMKDSQVDWSTGNDFPQMFRTHTPGDCYCVWVCDLTPIIGTGANNGRTDGTGDSRKNVWQEVIDKVHDARYKALGNRIMMNLASQNIDPKWFIGRPFHECQQTNYYRVWPDTKTLFRDALDRMIEMIREGAGYNLRWFFCPAMDRTYKGGDFGTLASWCPTNVDGISQSFHPKLDSNDRKGYLRLIDGDATYYGAEGDTAALCRLKGWPLGFYEWSPRYNTNHIADSVYNWFFREYMWPRADDTGIVCDLVYDQDTLNTEAAVPYLPSNDPNGKQTAAGVQNWRDSVPVFKHFWKGKGPNWTNYNVPTSKPDEWYPP